MNKLVPGAPSESLRISPSGAGMNEQDNGGAAFPEVVTYSATDEIGRNYSDVMSSGGMSLRDYFAGRALTGFVAAYSGPCSLPDPNVAAARVYEYADAMLKARQS